MSMTCVLCEKFPAVMYCIQDEAHLCAACDEQVHSANLLASRHERRPISAGSHRAGEQPARSNVSSDSANAGSKQPKVATQDELTLDDDAIFAVPDVDVPGGGHDDAHGHKAIGKVFASGELDFAEMDPLWLDRLDVGLDRLPSDILDSLVPEAPPPPRLQGDNSQQLATPAPAPAHSTHVTVPAAAVAHMPVPQVKPTQPQQPQVPAMHVMPHGTVMPPAASAMAMYSQAGVPPPSERGSVDMDAAAKLDIETYIPRSLLPMEPALRDQLLSERRVMLERFREKKRNRHFKKTIRYASRKAYAEVRPRIKGRFARKAEVAAMRASGALPLA